MTRRRYTHDADVSNVELAEIWDVQDDETPTRAELADDPTWPAPKRAGAERGQGDH